MRAKRASRKARGAAASEAVELRLYVVDSAPNSMQAIANVGAICEEFLGGRFTLEIIDVLLQPVRALADGVLVTPLLRKVSPGPGGNVIGNLSSRRDVIRALGL